MSDKNKKGLSTVIPIFNEEKNIEGLFKKIIECDQRADFPCQFILVDGCSTDNTAARINEFCLHYQSLDIKFVSMDSRGGYGQDIISGLGFAVYETMAWTHADLQTDICDLITGYHFIKETNKPTVIKGKRKGRSILDRILSFGMQIYTFLKIKIYLDDINAQPKIFNKNFYKKYLLSDPPKDFSLDLYFLILAKSNNYKIQSFDVFFHRRELGEAKGGGGSWKNRINLIKRTRQYIISMSKRI